MYSTNDRRSLTTPIALAVVAAAAIIGGGIIYYAYTTQKQAALQDQAALTTTPVSKPVTPPPAQPEPAAKAPLIVLLASQNNSGESGTATLTDMNGQVQVVLAMSGAPADSSQPAHIHVGACPNPGTPIYPLNPVVNGTSTTMITGSIDTLMTQLPLAINVHKSSTELSSYVACGDVIKESAASNKSAPLTASDETKFAAELTTLKSLQGMLGVSFSAPVKEVFSWNESNKETDTMTEITVSGVRYEYVDITGKAGIEVVAKNLVNSGYVRSDTNQADGPFGEQQGYKKGDMVCTVTTQTSSVPQGDMPPIATGPTTISIACGMMQ